MCDRLPPQRIDARNMASLGHMAACAQALADEDGTDLLLPDHAAAEAGPPAAGAIRDWSGVRPEERYAHGRHPPAWPDLPPPSGAAPAPAWTRRLAAWLRDAERPDGRPAGH